MPERKLAAHTRVGHKSFDMWITEGKKTIIQITEGAYVSNGWAHKKTTQYSTLAAARAAYTRRTGITPEIGQ